MVFCFLIVAVGGSLTIAWSTESSRSTSDLSGLGVKPSRILAVTVGFYINARQNYLKLMVPVAFIVISLAMYMASSGSFNFF